MMTSPSHDTYKYNNQAKLNVLTNLVVKYIDKVYKKRLMTKNLKMKQIFSENNNCHLKNMLRNGRWQ